LTDVRLAGESAGGTSRPKGRGTTRGNNLANLVAQLVNDYLG